MPGKVYYINKDMEVRFLSNFSKHPVEIDGKIYETSEHYFQAAKFFKTDPEWAEKVAAVKGPAMSARMGRSREHKIDEDWDKGSSIAFMTIALVAKIKQNQEVMDQLMATGDGYIVERADWDSIWGDGPELCGENRLGRLWIHVRRAIEKGLIK